MRFIRHLNPIIMLFLLVVLILVIFDHIKGSSSSEAKACMNTYKEMLLSDTGSDEFVSSKDKVLSEIEYCKRDHLFEHSDFYKQLQQSCKEREQFIAKAAIDPSFELPDNDSLHGVCGKVDY